MDENTTDLGGSEQLRSIAESEQQAFDDQRLRARTTVATASQVTDAMIEAGIDACQKMKDAMELREMSDKPEDMPDYDEGDVMRSIYLAMHAARHPTASEPENRS